VSEFEKELAKAGGQVVTETARDARKAVSRVFGDAAQELAAMMGDQMRFWRFQHLVAIMEKVERIAAERGLAPEQMKALPFGEAIRVAEAASYEEEPALQELWARLIANAIGDPADGGVQRSFIDLLKSLSPAEAAFLDLLWIHERLWQIRETEERAGLMQGPLKTVVTAWESNPVASQRVSIQNLLRLRCIAVRPPSGVERSLASFATGRSTGAALVQAVKEVMNYISVSVGGTSPGGPSTHIQPLPIPAQPYSLTPLGRALMHACRIDL